MQRGILARVATNLYHVRDIGHCRLPNGGGGQQFESLEVESWTFSSLPQLPSIGADRVSPVVPQDDPRVPGSRVPGQVVLLHQLPDLSSPASELWCTNWWTFVMADQREIVRLRMTKFLNCGSQLACRSH